MAEIDNLLERSAGELSRPRERAGAHPAAPAATRPCRSISGSRGRSRSAHVCQLPQPSVNSRQRDAARSGARCSRPASRRSCADSSVTGRSSRWDARSPAALVAYLRALRQRQTGRCHHDAARGRGPHLLQRRGDTASISCATACRSRRSPSRCCAMQGSASAGGRRAERADRANACRALRQKTRCHCWMRACSRGSGSAMPSPRPPISMSGTTSAVWCCGRRRFTLFPPRADRQSLHRTARFCPHRRADEPGAAARAGFHALSEVSRGTWRARVGAELGPGDALFIPPLWWHHVESLEPLNMLVNYWWHAAGATRLGGRLRV